MPFPLDLFSESLRHRSSPVAYVHHVGPATLALWGVRYIWAKPDGAFKEHILSDGEYATDSVTVPTAPSDAYACRLLGVSGGPVFAPDSVCTENKAITKLFRMQPLPRAGVLLNRQDNNLDMVDLTEVRMDVEAQGPVDVILKSGVLRRSFVLGPGKSTLHVPFEHFRTGNQVEYEINPVYADNKIRLLRTSARPFLLDQSVVRRFSVSVRDSFANIENDRAGKVYFPLPWHAYWHAEVDGVTVPTERGPSGVVAVPVQAGKHLISLHYQPRKT